MSPNSLSYLEAMTRVYPSAPVNPDWTLEVIQQEETERLTYNYLVASVAASYRHWERTPEKPFRIRQLDVKWSRRIMHCYKDILRQSYGVLVPTPGLEPNAAQTQAGAVVIWLDWWSSHRVWLRGRLAGVAKWALTQDEEIEWDARKIVQAIEDEHNRLLHAFRGIDGLSREFYAIGVKLDRRKRR